MSKRLKVLTIADMPISTSGVGLQTGNMCRALLKSEKYDIVSIGGAIRHESYQPIKTEEFGDHWTIYPVDNYGTHDIVRSMIRTERPDIMWIMTDPRFFTGLWEIECEIRPLMPIVYYTIWDNYPPPMFNRPHYMSNDLLVAISKVSHEVAKVVSPEVETIYLPHAVDGNIFKRLPDEQVANFKKESFTSSKHPNNANKFVFFWNSRNARRKQSGTVIFWFNEFLKKVGKDKAVLLMHTNPLDENGQNLNAIVDHLGLSSEEIMFSQEKVPLNVMSLLYNMADCTINISDAEGFGLSALESLSCETPVIVNMTGGLQEQVYDGKQYFGVGIEPCSKAIIGSQEVPYIYEDRISQEDFVAALEKMFYMPKEEREEIGRQARKHVDTNYNFDTFEKRWVEIFDMVHEKHGSWPTKQYKTWSVKTL